MDDVTYHDHLYEYGFCSGKRKLSGKRNGADTGENRRRKGATISQ